MSTSRDSLPFILLVALFAVLVAVPTPSLAKTKSPAKPGSGAKPAAAPAKAIPANTKLAQLEDRRSDGSYAKCTLGIELPDIPAFAARAARVLVTTAVDDLGTNLLLEDAAAGTLEPTQRGFAAKEGDTTITIVFAEMKNPPRQAKVLKEVSGEIELYLPGQDPNAEAGFPKFLSLAGKPLAHPALKANGVEIAYLSAEQLAAERKKAETAARAKLRKEGYTDKESLAEMVDSALSGFPKGEQNEVILRVKDPHKVLQEIRFVDGEGKPAFAVKTAEAGLTTLSFYSGNPGPDWEMKFQMLSAKSLVRQTFAMKDIALP